MSVLLFLIVLAVLILSHELGHFIVAKKNGIRVDEFGFGFPPRLFKFQKGETIYSVNLIPFGGFVKIYGEEGQDAGDLRSFASKSIKVRAIIIAAGVVFNLILAWVLLSSGLITGLPASTSAFPNAKEIKDIKITIIEVAKNSPAESGGLKAGDEILEFSKIENVKNFIDQNKGREMEMQYKRGDIVSSVKIMPRENPPLGQGAIGIVMNEVGIVKLAWYQAPWEGLKMTFQMTVSVAVAIFYFIVNIVKGLAGLEGVIGPVGIVSVTGAAAKMGFAYLLSFTAFLSINLAVINIIPFPALDGGRLLFLLIEKIKGSPVSRKFSGISHGIGLILLLILMFAITYRDILKLI
ncbi:MAG: RIP metalloprotease RseP [Candidatus Terrybacteria bacterium]|nr:RIP metalloprotease RseP [Candidatus Terrybacteria bacterium]MBI4812054.1 RIP metalloprotease RseP [Candidatus Falkowbacteria bacterium]